MAIVTQIICASCGTHTQVSHSPSEAPVKICGVCRSRVAGEKREKALAALEEMSVEERLARIEAWIYDYRPPVSLSEMRF